MNNTPNLNYLSLHQILQPTPLEKTEFSKSKESEPQLNSKLDFQVLLQAAMATGVENAKSEKLKDDTNKKELSKKKADKDLEDEESLKLEKQKSFNDYTYLLQLQKENK